MRRSVCFGLASLAAMTILPIVAEAQDRPLTLRVAPRSFLDPGNVVRPGSLGGTMANHAYQSTFINRPSAWYSSRDLYGEGTLPDPVGGPGPWVGAENPFDPLGPEIFPR